MAIWLKNGDLAQRVKALVFSARRRCRTSSPSLTWNFSSTIDHAPQIFLRAFSGAGGARFLTFTEDVLIKTDTYLLIQGHYLH
jgi:hypothetical protein